MTPTARSLEKLRNDGWTATKVEHWIPASPAGFKGPLITRDAFNFGDILACRVGQPGALLVQATTAGHINARIQKIRGIAEAGVWLAAGNSISVMGWSKRGPRGKQKRWVCREVEFLPGGVLKEGNGALNLSPGQGAGAVSGDETA